MQDMVSSSGIMSCSFKTILWMFAMVLLVFFLFLSITVYIMSKAIYMILQHKFLPFSTTYLPKHYQEQLYMAICLMSVEEIPREVFKNKWERMNVFNMVNGCIHWRYESCNTAMTHMWLDILDSPRLHSLLFESIIDRNFITS